MKVNFHEVIISMICMCIHTFKNHKQKLRNAYRDCKKETVVKNYLKEHH